MNNIRLRKGCLILSVIIILSINIFQDSTYDLLAKGIEALKVHQYQSLAKDIDAVVVQKNTLLSVSLYNKTENTILDENGVFSRPIISPSKKFVAYIKNKNLFITDSNYTYIKIADNIDPLAFSWQNGNNLIYSPRKGGLYIYDISNKVIKVYIKNESNYHNITFDSKGNIYAEKYNFYKKDGSDYIADYGIVFINGNTKDEKLVIKSIPSDLSGSGSLGMYPVIAKIAKDDTYLYIWEHPHSASMAADGVDFATYDILNNKLIEYKSPNIISLAYRDNLSINPKDSKSVALIYGAGREMSRNKHLVILDVLHGNIKDLTKENVTTMTPNYLCDGKTIVYASSLEQYGTKENIDEWLTNGKHHIYSMDTMTKKIRQLTSNPNYFDFSPKYISNNMMLLFRSDNSDNVSLWKLQNGKETILADSLIFYDTSYPIQNYYGHFNTELFTDIKD